MNIELTIFFWICYFTINCLRNFIWCCYIHCKQKFEKAMKKPIFMYLHLLHILIYPNSHLTKFQWKFLHGFSKGSKFFSANFSVLSLGEKNIDITFKNCLFKSNKLKLLSYFNKLLNKKCQCNIALPVAMYTKNLRIRKRHL